MNKTYVYVHIELNIDDYCSLVLSNADKETDLILIR